MLARHAQAACWVRGMKRRVEVTYRCRDIGYGIEEGIFVGTRDDEYIDAWGKIAFRVEGGEDCYLFPDEILSEEETP